MEYISPLYLHKDTENLLLPAAERGDVGMILKLMRKKANPNLTDENGRSALTLAAAGNWREIHTPVHTERQSK